MIKYFLVICFSFFTQFSFGQSAEALLQDAKKTEEIPNETLALAKYKTITSLYPGNVKANAKAGELCLRIASRSTDNKTQQTYYTNASQYANKALQLAPLNDDANVLKAMVLGKISMTQTAKEKIKAAKQMKAFLDVALSTNPNNHLALHVLARWHIELAAISLFERAAAKLMLGSIPEGSEKLAISLMEKSRTLSPGFTLNTLELGKAYYLQGEKIKAKKMLNELLTYRITTEDDAALKSQARNYLAQWK